MKLPVLILAAFCLLLAGCGQSVLVGKFRTPTGENLELLNSGALILQKDQNSVAGHWEALDSDRVSLKFDNFGGESIVCSFKPGEDDVIFSDCRLAGRLTRIR